MKTLLQSDRTKTVLTLLAWGAFIVGLCLLCSCARTPLPKEDPTLRAYHDKVRKTRAKLKRGWYTNAVDNVRRDTLTSAATGLSFPVTQP